MMAVALCSFTFATTSLQTCQPLIYDSLAHSGPHNSRLIPLVEIWTMILLIRAVRTATRPEIPAEKKKEKEKKRKKNKEENDRRKRGGRERDCLAPLGWRFEG